MELLIKNGAVFDPVNGIKGDKTDIPIKDGKIDGSNISFTLSIEMGGDSMQLSYKGVVSAGQIKLTGEAMGQPFELVVKKAQ